MDKNRLLIKIILTALLILTLAACTGQPAEPTSTATPQPSSTPIPPTATQTLVPTETSTPIPTKLVIEKGDYLIYQPRTGPENHLFFYDPATNSHIPILPDWNINNFDISINDQIAFSSTNLENEDKFATYILDYPYWENTPINLTYAPNASQHPIEWSPDGKYLVVMSFQDNGNFLSIWDGTQFHHIYEFNDEEHLGSSENVWSMNGQFAFTVFPEYMSKTEVANIYVWDGDLNHRSANISENFDHAARFPTWSPEGQLTFFVGGSFVFWDGESREGNAPDTTSLIEIHFENCYPFSYWTNLNEVLVCGTYYAWDGTNLIATHEEKNGYGISGFTWRQDGFRVGATNPFNVPNPQQLFVFDSKDNLVLQTEGRWGSWSPEGNLAYCIYDRGDGFSISIWDGTDLITILENMGDIFAMWRNGESIHCSNG